MEVRLPRVRRAWPARSSDERWPRHVLAERQPRAARPTRATRGTFCGTGWAYPHDGARVRGAPESPSLHPVSDARPANVSDERNGPIADLPVARTGVVARTGNVRVVDEQRPAAHVALGHDSPIPAILRAIAIVA